MKYRKTITLLCSSVFFWGNLAQADKTQIPYVLAQTVNNIPVEQSQCINLIREAHNVSEQLQEQKMNFEQQLELIKAQYDEANLNYQEAELTTQSIQQHLEASVTQIFEQLSQTDANFSQLSEDEQLQIIETNPNILQLKQQYDDAINMMNEWSATLQQMTTEYQTIQYQLEQANTQADSESEENTDLNQCRLYPYSVPYFIADPNLVNVSSEKLEDYLAMLHQSMQEIIPNAFRKLSYKQIMDAFNPEKHSPESVQQALAGKQKIVLSEEGKHYYTYAQELNLFDVQILANMALSDYYQTEDINALQRAYFEILQIKDGQLAYVYALNEEQFKLIQDLLVQYLNNHHLTSEKDIQKVKDFHDLYQVQLVFFNENEQQWHPTEQDLATYSRRFYEVDFANGITVNRSNSLDEVASYPDETENLNNEKETHENLERIKNKFNQRRKSTTPPSLPNPTKDSKKEKKDSVKDPVKLPSTGEQQVMWWVSGSIALIAVILGFIQLVVYFKEQKRRKNIQLDENHENYQEQITNNSRDILI